MTKLVVSKDRITVTEADRYVSGTVDAYKCSVTFSREWEGLDRKIVFRAVVGDDICEEVYESVPAVAMSMKFAIPNKMFQQPAQKLQIYATGSRKGKSQAGRLLTPWVSLGRVIEGGSAPECPCPDNPDTPDLPTPPSYSIPPGGTKGQVLGKASDDDYDFTWLSVSGLPIVTATGVNAPIKSISYFAGALSEIPEGWALCDGQNGTPDLRDKVIIGKSTDDTEPNASLAEGTSVALYALWPIMNISAEPSTNPSEPGKDGKSAYDIAVEHGFEGTEEEWLESLKGASAYELAVQAGYVGSEEAFSKALNNLASFPIVSNEVILNAKDLPTEGDGSYIFENVIIGSSDDTRYTFSHELVYLDTSEEHTVKLTLISGTMLVYTVSQDDTQVFTSLERRSVFAPTASSIPYDNTVSKLDAADVQTAIDVLAARPSSSSTSSSLSEIRDKAITNISQLSPYTSEKAYQMINVSFGTATEVYAQFADNLVYYVKTDGAIKLSTLEGLLYTITVDDSGEFVSVKMEDSYASTTPTGTDVAFDDTNAKLGAANVQTAIEALATASPIIKDVTFSNIDQLAGYQMNQTYRMIDVVFRTTPNTTQLLFGNDVVWMSWQSDGRTPELYTLDGTRTVITVDDNGLFTSFNQEDAYDTAAPEPLPFLVLENGTITALDQLEELGVVNGEAFFARNVSFRLPNAEEDAMSVSGSDFVKASWTDVISLYIYSGSTHYTIEWDNNAEGKPFTKIEEQVTTTEQITSFTDISTTNVNDLRALSTFFDRSIQLRNVQLNTSGGESRSYSDDVVYAEDDESSKTVTITRLNNMVDFFSYGDDGVFTSIVSRQNGIEETVYADGLTKTDNEVRVSNPNRGILTQEQFDALSEEEKASGTYVINDDEHGETFSVDPTLSMSPTNVLGVTKPIRVFTPEDYNALSAEEKKRGLIFVPQLPSTAELMQGLTYSLEERVVGTWIDGSTLYQRTIKFENEAFPEAETNTSILKFSDYGISDIVNAYGVLQISWLSQRKYFIGNSKFMLNTTSDALYLWQNLATAYVGQPYNLVLTIMYTKTDETSAEAVSE